MTRLTRSVAGMRRRARWIRLSAVAAPIALSTALVACGSGVAPAQVDRVGTPGAPDATAIVAGRVLTSTGRPLDSVAVLVRERTVSGMSFFGASELTDSAGQFRIQVLRFGKPEVTQAGDTASAYVVAFTTEPKYPLRDGRSVGLDSVLVRVTFTPKPATPRVTDAQIRLTLP